MNLSQPDGANNNISKAAGMHIIAEIVSQPTARITLGLLGAYYYIKPLCNF
jgi:hypothetical protein